MRDTLKVHSQFNIETSTISHTIQSMPRKRKIKLLLASAILLITCASILLFRPVSLTPPPKITIGPDTTLFTEPLHPDGTVDYVAAINRKLSEGVTPQNNAFVALLPVIGTSRDMLGPTHQQIVKMAGAEESPGCWNPLPPIPDATDAQSNARDALITQLQKSPWSPADHPDIDQWVTSNNKALELVAAAVGRNRYWLPLTLVKPDDLLITASESPEVINSFREIEVAMRSERCVFSQLDKIKRAGRICLPLIDFPTSSRKTGMFQWSPSPKRQKDSRFNPILQ